MRTEKTLIIIPTFNEIENISKIIMAVFDTGLSINILVVDDQSPDGTGQEVRKLMKTFPNRLFLESRSGKKGLGSAYIDGFKWALKRDYKYIFEMDADFSHQPKELKSMIKILDSDVDLVIGSRYVKGVNVVNWPLGRILLSYFASFYVQFITGMPIKDPTAGFVGYKRRVIDTIDIDNIKFIGYAFQIELKYRAWIKNFIIKEHPIIFINRVYGKSKMSGSIIWEAFFGVLLLRLKKKNFS
jgi:dolichol-phosphate mannosyltransferase